MKTYPFVRTPHFRRAIRLGSQKLSMLYLSLILCSAQGAFARVNRPTGTYPPLSLASQLSMHLRYPAVSPHAAVNGVVVIQFRLDTQQRITEVQVHTQDKALNAYITGRLTGKPVSSAVPSPQGLYTVRLRFRLT